MKKNKWIYSFLIILVSASCGMLADRIICRDDIRFAKDFKELAEVYRFVEDKTNLKITDKRQAMADCINAYYKVSDDRYFLYDNHSDDELLAIQINNYDMLKQNGFSVDVTDEGEMLIASVEENSYAAAQGLRQGDIITQIDEYNFKKDGFQTAAKKLSAKSGTESDFYIKRDGEELVIHYKRQHYKVQHEDYVKMLENNICYIDYREKFDWESNSIFWSASKLYEDKAEAYIIDLRDNTGGETQAAIEAASLFFDQKDFMIQYLSNGDEKKLSTNGEMIFDKKVVILVNDMTASASEIFTAGMKQFYHDTIIVGTTTLGKGIFQYVEEFENGGRLKYTAGYFTVGDWECWQGKGISPDVEVGMDRSLIGTDDDIQLQTAIKLLSE